MVIYATDTYLNSHFRESVYNTKKKLVTKSLSAYSVLEELIDKV